MARLGELLIAAGELTAQQVEQALRAQVLWGGRLGTNLVELGYIDLDKLATALGKQHHLPPALGRHFDKSDPNLQGKLSPNFAEKFACVPLLHAGAGRANVIVAAMGPLDKRAIAIVAEELAVEPKAIVPSIAAELRIRYHLERVYQIPRGTRFLRSKGKTIPPFPQFEIDPFATEDSQVDVPVIAMPPKQPAVVVEEPEDDLAIEEVRGELRARLDSIAAEKAAEEAAAKAAEEQAEADALAIFSDVTALTMLDDEDENETIAIPVVVDPEVSTGRERRRYVRMIDASEAEPEPALEQPSLGRIAIKRVPVAAAVDEPNAGSTIGEATRAIRRSTDRDRVAELVSETLFRFMMSCDAAQMLVIRGDAALSWKGFSRAGGTLPEIAVPLDQPGLIPRVIERCATCRSPATDLGPIDQLLLVSLGVQSGELAVVPVSIASQVMCVIALVTQPGASIATAESIAVAAGQAFARLMRNASR